MQDDSTTFWLFLLLIYFAPAMIASKRRHRQRTPILALNLFAGWTFVGWLAALVWALSADVDLLPPPLPPLQRWLEERRLRRNMEDGS